MSVGVVDDEERTEPCVRGDPPPPEPKTETTPEISLEARKTTTTTTSKATIRRSV
jgi:hypothetical protein